MIFGVVRTWVGIDILLKGACWIGGKLVPAPVSFWEKPGLSSLFSEPPRSVAVAMRHGSGGKDETACGGARASLRPWFWAAQKVKRRGGEGIKATGLFLVGGGPYLVLAPVPDTTKPESRRLPTPDPVPTMRGAVTLGDLRGRLAMLSVECEKCGRAGRYRLAGLIAAHGEDTSLPDLASSLAKSCEQPSSSGSLSYCPIRFPDLADLR